MPRLHPSPQPGADRAGRVVRRVRPLTLLSACLVLLPFAVGCGDDDPGDPNNTPSEGQIALTLNGARHVFDGAATGVVARPGLLQLGAIKSNGSELVTLAVPDAEGTEPLGIDGGVNLNISVGGAPYTATDQTGTITVTSVGATRVSGTFSCNVVHPQDDQVTATVTDGTFDVPVAR